MYIPNVHIPFLHFLNFLRRDITIFYNTFYHHSVISREIRPLAALQKKSALSGRRGRYASAHALRHFQKLLGGITLPGV